MTVAKIVAPFNFNFTFPEPLDDELKRNVFIETIERLLIEEDSDVIFLEGKSGSGKTTIISQFINKQFKNSISYFVSSIDRYSQSRESLNINLYNQLNNYLSFSDEEIVQIPDNFIYQLRPQLDRKIRKLPKGEYLFLIFDGLECLTKQALEIFKEVLSDLPWGKAKFIFTGDIDLLKSLLPSTSKLKIRSFPISFFTIEEIAEYFSGFNLTIEQIKDIHLLSNRGLPEILSRIKRNFNEKEVSDVLNELSEKRLTLFEMDWQKVDTELQVMILSVLAFSEPFYILKTLSQILQIKEEDIKFSASNIPFLTLKGNTLSFANQEYLTLVRKKLADKEQQTLALLIDFYVSNTGAGNGNQLSNLYVQAKRWKDLLKYLSFETFLRLIEESKSFDAVTNQLNIGLKASKDSNNAYFDFLRFSLPKSSFKEIEKIDGLESEIKARVALGDNEGALALLDSTFLVEDRLKLLANLAKQQKINNVEIDPSIINQIKELYDSVNVEALKDGAVKLASTLLYSCPDLAIDLVEKTTEETEEGTKLDKVYTLLSLTALRVNKNSDSSVADLTVLQDRISNTEERELVLALSHLSEEYNASEIIEKANALNSSARKLYILKNWIKFNIKNIDVVEVINEALKEVIKSSGDDTPNANTLMELAQPLPFIRNYESLEHIIEIFDTQKETIITPTRDYVKLQLLLAEGEGKFEKKRAACRLIDIYYYIASLDDVAIKNDCLVLLWLKLKLIDPEDEIEKKEGLKALAKQDADQLLNNIIGQTAMHFEVMEYVISYSVEFDGDFVLNIINRLNTQVRRDFAYKLAIEKYVEGVKASEANIDFILKCYRLICYKAIKDHILIQIIDYLVAAEELDNITYFFQVLDDIKQINDSESRCYALCEVIKVFEKGGKDSVVANLLDLLKKSWEAIDTLWIKVKVASQIAIQIADYSKELAKKYLDDGLQEKCDSVFESYSSAHAYFLSLKLSIRSFGGLIKQGHSYDDDLQTLYDLIEVIPCYGERIRLYSNLAINFYNKNEESTFKSIFKQFVIPAFSSLSNSLDKEYYTFIFKRIGPALYLYHPNTFTSYLEKVDSFDRDSVLMDCVYFLLRKLYSDDHYDLGDYRPTLSYERATDVLELIRKMDYDNSIYIGISELIQSLKVTKEISVNQRNLIAKDLEIIINSKLPNPVTGVKHDGYKIAATIFLDSLKGAQEKAHIEHLVGRIKLIPNTSDRSLILHILARELKFKSTAQRLEVMLDAFAEAKKIPSTFDMLMRHEEMLPTMADLEKSQFKKIIQELISTIIIDKEDENIYYKHRKLVDLLHQYDPKNIGSYIDVLDKDPARNRQLTETMKDRLDLLERDAKYRDDITKARKFRSGGELSEFSYKLLSKVQAGVFTPKDPKETFSLLEAAAQYNLSDSYNTYAYCIENLVRKYQNGMKHQDLVRLAFEATIFNAKLISALTQSSIQNMRNRYSIINRAKTAEKKFFRLGERELALNFFKRWLEDVTYESITLIDSYFKPHDVEFLKLVKEVNPKLEVFVLTSKEGLKDIVDYEKEYMESWIAISDERAPTTTIKIVWIDGTDKTPFHDRYLVAGGDEGLRLGSSYGGFGFEKVAEVSIMSEDQMGELEDTIIRDYVLGGKHFHNDKRLRFKTVTL
ncbi:NB-ARC domain-containing protein [Desertivirga arenae]|uniref:NB-ARC domain-containing protein n=1 Tax=Desertivirga arenae TaxID=2810309 RepID=UPI001A9688A6|nr:NB-ARC domain-containing protein [Pedobacter sp. SYSU D00823]